ncbi:MAG: hypothetical protein HC887_13260 [Desulfobacteraceae bacterium]|nr:hypothetical protein [Desulfobacteraceae bacterium]
MSEPGDGNSVGYESWREFTERLRNKNQRLFLEYFLEQEQSDKEKYSDFDKLCSDLGI